MIPIMISNDIYIYVINDTAPMMDYNNKDNDNSYSSSSNSRYLIFDNH